MDKKDYYNSVTSQVEELETLGKIQSNLCFDLNKLRTMLPQETAGKIKRVIITGCGDSYSAAGAMLPGFKKLSGISSCASPDAMDFLCYYTPAKISGAFKPEEVLFVGISFSGTSQRVVDGLEKANELGILSLIITRNPDSLGAKTAKYVFDVATPEGCNTPGLRSYYASMVGLCALASYLGLSAGRNTEEQFTKTGDSIASYTETFMKEFGRIDQQMFDLALELKNYEKYLMIADWNEGYSAQFVEQKFIECGGVFCTHTTSEEFAHIDFFVRCPNETAVVVMVNESDTSMSRMKDTVNGCLAQQRPTLIVTDADPETFEITSSDTESAREMFKMFSFADVRFDSMAQARKPVVCRIPKAPEQWLSPLMDFVPGTLLAAYQAAVNEQNFFAGRYDFRTQTWVGM